MPLLKTTSGTVTLSGGNGFSGGLTIQSGTVVASASAFALGAGTVTLGDTTGSNAASLLAGGTTSPLTYSNPIVLANGTTGALTIGNTGTDISATFTGGVTGTNNLTLNSNAGLGTITFKTGSINIAGKITNAGTASTGNLVTTGASIPNAAVAILSAIGPSVTAVVQNGPADLVLGGNNSSSSFTTTITSGRIDVADYANPLAAPWPASKGVSLAAENSSVAILNFAARMGGVSFGNATIAGAINVSGTGANYITATDSSPTFSGAVTLGTHLTIASLNSSGSSLTFSGGVNGTGNIIVSNDFGNASNVVSFSAAPIDNAGTLTYNNDAVLGGTAGTGTGTNTITGGVGNSVTAITQASNSNPLTLSTTALAVNSAATTLTASGTALLTVSGGVNGTGNLTLNNNSSTTGAITVSTTSVNHTGTITNSGLGAGGVTIAAVIGSNVTGVYQNSATSGLTLSGGNTFTNDGTTSFGLNIQAGSVTASTSANALGAGAVTLGHTSGSHAATLLVSTTGLTYANPIVLATNPSVGTLTIGNTGTAISTTFSGGVTGKNNFTINSNATTGTITFNTNAINNEGTLTNAGTASTGNVLSTGNALPNAAVAINSSIGANVTAVVQNGPADLVLGGNNSSAIFATTIYSGRIDIANYAANSAAPWPASKGVSLAPSAGAAIVNYGARLNGLNFSGDATVAGSLSVAGAGASYVSATDANATFSGAISLSANLTIATLNSTGSNLTFSGGVTGTGNVTVSNDFSSINSYVSFSAASVNNAGTLTYNNDAVLGGTTGTGTGTNTITGGVGTNVTAITQASNRNPLTISNTALTVNSTATTLTASGAALVTLTGGVTGTGNLTLNNNAGTVAGIIVSTTAVNHSGTITNSGSGASVTISAAIGSSVTGVIQSSAASGMTLSGANTFTNNGTTTRGLNIQAGVVTASTSASALGAGAVTLGDTAGSNAATLLVSTTGLTYANPIVLATNASAGTLTIGNTGGGSRRPSAAA